MTKVITYICIAVAICAIITAGIYLGLKKPLQPKDTVEKYNSNEPIDLVVTWVCSDPDNDTLWEHYARQEGIEPDTNNSRVQSLDEIRYLFRSIDMFAPWINHVYLVSVTGAPEWLDTNHPKLTVVPHIDIFKNPDHLPTFNSYAIEAQVHRIPGLSERFIFCNDDMFFAAPVSPSDFFDSQGKAKLVFGDKLTNKWLNLADDGHKYAASWRNTKNCLETRDNISITHNLFHQAKPMLKSVMFEAEEWYPDIFEDTVSRRLSSVETYNIFGLVTYYGLATDRFYVGEIPNIMVAWELNTEHHRKELDKAMKNRPKLLCINNLTKDDFEIWYNFAESYYHRQSAFELVG